MSGPLDGAGVVDLSSALAGPISSRLMPAENAQRRKAAPVVFPGGEAHFVGIKATSLRWP